MKLSCEQKYSTGAVTLTKHATRFFEKSANTTKNQLILTIQSINITPMQKSKFHLNNTFLAVEPLVKVYFWQGNFDPKTGRNGQL